MSLTVSEWHTEMLPARARQRRANREAKAMTYVLVRLYTGSSDRSVDDILKVVGQELAPQVIKGGCKRYSVVEFSDGRIGSSSFYEDRAAAERGSEIAAKWVSASGLMKGYKLVQTISGETVYTYQG